VKLGPCSDEAECRGGRHQPDQEKAALRPRRLMHADTI
jgi:hypothetical protein